jgi:GxxExxY protein
MVIELEKAGLNSEEEKSLEVYYDNIVVGNFSIDLYVEGTVVVELKSVQSLLIEHEVQLVNYLKGMKRDIGLLINFSPSGVDVKRKFKEFDK